MAINASNVTLETSIRPEVIEQLQSFFRGEVSAVETYGQALSHESLKPFVEVLRRCQRSHQARVDLLREEIRRLGGEVPQGSGLWGAFAKTVQGAANVLSAKAAIAVLEEGEDHGMRDYETDIDKLDAATRSFVREYIFPAQLDTHRMVSELKHALQ